MRIELPTPAMRQDFPEFELLSERGEMATNLLIEAAVNCKWQNYIIGSIDCGFRVSKMKTQLVRRFASFVKDAHVLGIIPAIQGARASYGSGRLYLKIK